jgi:hypothetical protein
MYDSLLPCVVFELNSSQSLEREIDDEEVKMNILIKYILEKKW